MGLIDLGLVDGNFFNAANVDSLELAINNGQPAGIVVMTCAAAAPTGWLFLSGQVVTNFQGLYPQTWAVIPAGWKSGSNANLPNMEQKFPIGAHTSFPLGTSGGSLTKTIAVGNLPSHQHDMSHTHPAHSHSGTTGNNSQDHTHGVGPGYQFVIENFSGPNAINISAGSGATVTSAGGTIGAAGTSDGTANHTHAFTTGTTADAFSGSTGNTGSGTALDITPSWVSFNFMLRVY